MSVFIPTFLYIKQHTITGKLYFGKTIKDPETYLGSGKHWVGHINKHGKEHVVNLWYCLFLDKETINEFALSFSHENTIVESNEWLNLMPENGTNGGAVKNNHFKILNHLPKSQETRRKMSESIKKNRSGGKHPVKVWIDGLLYPSISAAAREFATSDAAIHYWIKCGKARRDNFIPR